MLYSKNDIIDIASDRGEELQRDTMP